MRENGARGRGGALMLGLGARDTVPDCGRTLGITLAGKEYDERIRRDFDTFSHMRKYFLHMPV